MAVVAICAVVVLRMSPCVAVSVGSLSPFLRLFNFFLSLLKRDALSLGLRYELWLCGSRFFLALGLEDVVDTRWLLASSWGRNGRSHLRFAGVTVRGLAEEDSREL